jgi:hypothetical protein
METNCSLITRLPGRHETSCPAARDGWTWRPASRTVRRPLALLRIPSGHSHHRGSHAACQPRALPVGNRASAVHKATSACPCGRRATAERPNHHRRPRIPKRSIYIANSRGCQIKVPLPGAAVHEFVQPSGHVGSTASGRGTWSVIQSRDQLAEHRCRHGPRNSSNNSVSSWK